jgi:hypothetical protein
MALYVTALVMAFWASTAKLVHPERIALVLAPVVPGLCLIGLTVNSYSRADEFIRLRILQAGAVSAVAVAAFALVYAFLELLGFPRLSAAWIYDLIWVVFAVQMLKLVATGK